MKTKKNAGFSLVELIVVIAIMAVLVGVLAPAYLKYVEKSRKSTDVSAVADIMDAATTVAGDAEYDVPAASVFKMAGASNKITLSVTFPNGASSDARSKAEEAWQDVASAKDGYSLKSKEFKAATAANAEGTVENNGSVTWKSDASGLFESMRKYSSSLDGKFED